MRKGNKFYGRGMSKINTMGRVQKSVEIIREHFGQGEFTSKEFNALKPKKIASPIETLRDYDIITVVREEQFQKAITQTYYEDANGTEYKKYQIGRRVRRCDVTEKTRVVLVDVKRYFYKLDENRLAVLVGGTKKSTLAMLERKIAEFKTQLEVAQNAYAMLA